MAANDNEGARLLVWLNENRAIIRNSTYYLFTNMNGQLVLRGTDIKPDGIAVVAIYTSFSPSEGELGPPPVEIDM